jgi:hypothetical protein
MAELLFFFRRDKDIEFKRRCRHCQSVFDMRTKKQHEFERVYHIDLCAHCVQRTIEDRYFAVAIYEAMYGYLRTGPRPSIGKDKDHVRQS